MDALMGDVAMAGPEVVATYGGDRLYKQAIYCSISDHRHYR
jgi:hypothetical protein